MLPRVNNSKVEYLVGKIRYSKEAKIFQIVPDPLNENNKKAGIVTPINYGVDQAPQGFEKLITLLKGRDLSIRANKNKIFGAHPYNGTFKAKFVEFVHSEGEQPVSELGTGKKRNGGVYDYYSFRLVLSLLDLGGVTLTMQLRHNEDTFVVGQDADGKDIVTLNGGGKWVDAIDATLKTIMEGYGKPIPARYVDNPLPAIQAIAQKMNRTFLVEIVNGYATRVFPEIETFTVADNDPEEFSLETVAETTTPEPVFDDGDLTNDLFSDDKTSEDVSDPLAGLDLSGDDQTDEIPFEL